MVEYGIAAGSASGRGAGLTATGGLDQIMTLGSSPMGLAAVTAGVVVLIVWLLR